MLNNMGEGKKLNRSKSNVSYVIAIGFLTIGLALPLVFNVDPAQTRILSILLFAVTLWATEAINPIVVSIAVIVLISLFEVLPYAEVAEGLGNTIIWRLIGIFIFAEAVRKSGLAQRLIFRILKFANGKVKNFLFLFLMLTFSFIFLIPAITGRSMIMLTMVLGLFSGLKISAPSNIGKIIFISLPILTLMSSTSVIVGSSSTIYTVGLIQEMTNHHFSYLSWLTANFPIGFSITIAMYFILTRLYPPEIEEIPGGTEYLNKEIEEAGPLTLPEKKVLLVYGILLFLWLFNLSADYPVELLTALILLLPKVGVLTWKEASAGVEWGILILFSAGFAIAKALQDTNVVIDFSAFVLGYIGNLSPMAVLVVLFFLTVMIRFGMNNIMPVVAALTPIVINIAVTLGINPIWLSLVTLYAATLIFLPTQTASGVLSYSYGYFSAREMVKAAVLINLVMFILIIAAAKFYWPLVGIPITH